MTCRIVDCGVCLFHGFCIHFNGRLVIPDVIIEAQYLLSQAAGFFNQVVHLLPVEFGCVHRISEGFPVSIRLLLRILRQEIQPFLCGFQFFLGFRPPARGHGQRDLVLPLLGHNVVVLLRQGVHVLLVGLRFCALLPGLHVGPQRVLIGVEGVGHPPELILRGTDLFRERRHYLEQGGQGDLVLPLLLLVHRGRIPHLLQPVDVHTGHLCGGRCGCHGVLHGPLALFHGGVQIPRRLGELPHHGTPVPEVVEEGHAHRCHSADPCRYPQQNSGQPGKQRRQVQLLENLNARVHTHDCSGHGPEGARARHDALRQLRVVLDHLVHPVQSFRPHLSQFPQFWVELLSDGALQCLHCGVQQGHVAVQVVQLHLGHALRGPFAVVDGVVQAVEVLLCGVDNGQQPVVPPHVCDFQGIHDLLRLRHLAEVIPQILDRLRQPLHGPIGIDGGVFHLSEGLRSQGDIPQQSVEDVAQRGARPGAFDAVVGHQAHHGGHVLDGVPQRTGHGRRILEGIPHDGNVRVGPVGCLGQHIGKVGGIRSLQSEGGQVVGHHVGHHAQVLVGRRRQGGHSAHTRQHILRRPARHGHVFHALGALVCRIDGGSAQLLCLSRQGLHLAFVCVGDGLHGGHLLLKVSRHLNRFHKRVLDLSKAVNDPGGHKGVAHRFKGLRSRGPELSRVFRRLLLLLRQLADLLAQLRALGRQVFCGYPRRVQPGLGSVQLGLLLFQGGLGVLDPLLQLQLFPFQPCGGSRGLLDLPVYQFILPAQVFQLRGGVLHRRLLLFIGGNIPLDGLQIFDLASQPQKLLLGFGEHPGKPAVEYGVQHEIYGILFLCHIRTYFLFSSLTARIHPPSMQSGSPSQSMGDPPPHFASRMHCFWSQSPSAFTPHAAKNPWPSG